MTESSTYGVNERDVTAKVLDGEAVIINLSTSVYYSMDRVGAFAWQALEQGCRLGDLIDSVTRRYEANRDMVESDLTSLFDQLGREGLVVASERAPTLPASTSEVPVTPYARPELVAYRDMADVLALDPPLPQLRPLDPTP